MVERGRKPRDAHGDELVDAIVFALVAVYFVNIYFFQNYTIPSSSLEKSLLVGDYLFVSKMSYGPRKPQTPLSMPLTQHTMPLVGASRMSSGRSGITSVSRADGYS